jgi:membrane-associated phospholipid phosphatase
MVAFSALCLLVTFAIFLLNLRFKASIHAAALAGSITALVSTFGVPVLPAYLLIIPVIWSRRKLRVHVITDLLVGALIGLLLGFAVYNFHNLITVIKP